MAASREDIENVFGRTNVAKWANIDSLADDDDDYEDHITARVEWALALASSKFFNEIVGIAYDVEETTDPLPLVVVDAIARWAGVLLYESRGVTDGNGDHDLRFHEDMARAVAARVKAGTLSIAGFTEIASNIPGNVIDDDEDDDDETWLESWTLESP